MDPPANRCEAHGRDHRRQGDSNRPSARQRGYSKRWEHQRTRHLTREPLCAHCLLEGRPVVATVLDHVIPHRGSRALFDEPTNRQGLCSDHHGTKINRELGRLPCGHEHLVQVLGRPACSLCGASDPGGRANSWPIEKPEPAEQLSVDSESLCGSAR